MIDYRIFIMGPEDRILRAVEMYCASDQDAAAEAARVSQGQIVELWQRARFVGRFRDEREH